MKADVAVKVFGDDMDVLLNVAQRVGAVLQRIPGATDVRVEQVTGLSVLTVQMKRRELARYGFNVADVQEAIEVAMGGKTSEKIYKGDCRFDLVIRLPERCRVDVKALWRLPIFLPQSQNAPAGKAIAGEARLHPLKYGSRAADQPEPQPNQSGNSKRRVVTTFNVRGRDLGSVVAEAKTQIQAQVKTQLGYWISWGGQFELLSEKRLSGFPL